jgi:hypothetical protein
LVEQGFGYSGITPFVLSQKKPYPGTLNPLLGQAFPKKKSCFARKVRLQPPFDVECRWALGAISERFGWRVFVLMAFGSFLGNLNVVGFGAKPGTNLVTGKSFFPAEYAHQPPMFLGVACA